MMAATERKETILELPWEIADSCNGFGMDFGGSVVKVIYLHNDDWEEPDKRTKEMAPYRLVNFARNEFDDAMKYLKPRVCIRRNAQDADEKPLLYTCGIGGSQFATEIRETFDIRCANITEMECLYESFKYMTKHKTLGELTEQVDPAYIKGCADTSRKYTDMLDAFAEDNKNFDISSGQRGLQLPVEIGYDVSKKFVDMEDAFPCFYVLGGSNGGIMMIKKDGSYQMANDMMRAGRMTMGLASLLTGCKTYDEFISMAERGNMRPIHEYLQDMSEGVSKDEDNFYVWMLERADDFDEPGFLFGKCVFKDLKDFQREDIALSFLYTSMSDWASTTHTTMRAYPEVKHVFFAGGFTSHPLVQKLVARQWIQKECFGRAMFGMESFSNFHFLRHSQHFGALGSLLNQKLKFKVVKASAIK